MTNTASILWPSAVSASPVVAQSEGSFYSQVSVSGPSVSTTVHRGQRVQGPIATLTREDAVEPAPAAEFERDRGVSTRRVEDDRQWGPWSLTQRDLEVLQLLA